MNKLEFNLWMLVLHKDDKLELLNHSYEYEYSKEEITELLLNKYKFYPLNLMLDKKYKNEFKLIYSTEDLKTVNYQTIDMGINYIKLNDELIYKGDM
nr:hypothetical protein [uncultured Romboutsia sp.]